MLADDRPTHAIDAIEVPSEDLTWLSVTSQHKLPTSQTYTIGAAFGDRQIG